MIEKPAKGSGATLEYRFAFKCAIKQNKQLAKELRKPIIRKLKKNSIQHLQTDIADMQLISKFDKGIRFYYVLLVFLVNIYGFLL